MAATLENGKAHAGIMLVFLLGSAAFWTSAGSSASYFRPTTAQGFADGVGAAVVVTGGVVVTVVATTVQHVALSQWPDAQTASPAFLDHPSGHVKLSQVGAGVVVTVLQGG